MSLFPTHTKMRGKENHTLRRSIQYESSFLELVFTKTRLEVRSSWRVINAYRRSGSYDEPFRLSGTCQADVSEFGTAYAPLTG